MRFHKLKRKRWAIVIDPRLRKLVRLIATEEDSNEKFMLEILIEQGLEYVEKGGELPRRYLYKREVFNWMIWNVTFRIDLKAKVDKLAKEFKVKPNRVVEAILWVMVEKYRREGKIF